MADQTTKLTLYTYFRSSSAARLRIALNLKALPYISIPVNLLKGEQSSPTNCALNPSGTVPTLVVERPVSQGATVTITQSLAALEYLEEITPEQSHALLPPVSDPEARAVVRTLSEIIACDVQPVTNLKILKRVAPLGFDREAWSKELIEDGFRAYETIISRTAGVFSVGDGITMADVCLLPAVWGAQRSGVNLREFPTIRRVAERLEEEDAVKKAHWTTQSDTPEEFRVTMS
ncbi:glutathione S-transferase [Aspergillus leporis]|jgi:maleylacetoacetate isomerase|uniref:Glutathione S-transferase n=1 Tax=Aspergillus leporis TaxID=41062 RepID=A0A5N5WRK3_9EURO|nr:glutathione S-transferase [Aspergillus leporis]